MKKLMEIIIVIAVLIIIVSVVFSGIRIVTLPNVGTDIDVILPNADNYYNSIANSNNGGSVCEYNDSVLVATSSGIVIVSSDNQESDMLIDGYAKSLNVVDDEVYFLDERNNIYVYDIQLAELKKIRENARYTKISVVGNIIYGYARIENSSDENKYGGINLESDERFLIRDTKYATDGIYYSGDIIYLEERKEGNVLISYNIENGEKAELFAVDNFDFSWIIDDGKIYYSYSNYDYEYDVRESKYISEITSIGIWECDLETNSNIKLSDSDSSISVKNILGDKLIYCDGPENNYSNWYILDLKTGSNDTFECTGSCNEIYVANNTIIIKNTNNGVISYRFYDEEGTYLDFEVPY